MQNIFMHTYLELPAQLIAAADDKSDNDGRVSVLYGLTAKH